MPDICTLQEQVETPDIFFTNMTRLRLVQHSLGTNVLGVSVDDVR